MGPGAVEARSDLCTKGRSWSDFVIFSREAAAGHLGSGLMKMSGQSFVMSQPAMTAAL